jgi:hypothetical protein
MTTETIPYAKAEPRQGWIGRHGTNAATRMVAFAIFALAGVGWRYLTSAVNGNADLPDLGKYVIFLSCAGFVFEFLISLIA